jgi:hypothetical protein
LVADHHGLASHGKCRLHIHSLVLLLDLSSSRLSFRWVYFAGSAGSDSDSFTHYFSIDFFLIAGLLEGFPGIGCPLEGLRQSAKNKRPESQTRFWEGTSKARG